MVTQKSGFYRGRKIIRVRQRPFLGARSVIMNMVSIVSSLMIICYEYWKNDYISYIAASFESAENPNTLCENGEKNWNIIFCNLEFIWKNYKLFTKGFRSDRSFTKGFGFGQRFQIVNYSQKVSDHRIYHLFYKHFWNEFAHTFWSILLIKCLYLWMLNFLNVWIYVCLSFQIFLQFCTSE